MKNCKIYLLVNMAVQQESITAIYPLTCFFLHNENGSDFKKLLWQIINILNKYFKELNHAPMYFNVLTERKDKRFGFKCLPDRLWCVDDNAENFTAYIGVFLST